MNSATDTHKLEQAQALMQAFVRRTGLETDETNATCRYLWTDAFALHNLLALKRIDGDGDYEAQSLRLINAVHYHLGRYTANDPRQGWISGLQDEKACKHPTIGGLRIGKKLPERQHDAIYDQQLEWERDGQYYHYHTRWISSLLMASKQLNDPQLAIWAAELSLAGSHFIAEDNTGLRMYWKMSVDLSRPLVPMMGAHDPLEGLLCALQANHETTVFKAEFDSYISKLRSLCARSHWVTDDDLGVGSLLLNVLRATDLLARHDLPPNVQPEHLLRDAEKGLERIRHSFDANQPAKYRLAFRECGLSLGLRCLKGNLDLLKKRQIVPHIDESGWQLADDIETFWLKQDNQQTATFQDHQDINEVSLAASLLANELPESYAGV